MIRKVFEQQITPVVASEIICPDESSLDQKEILAIAESIDHAKRLINPVLITSDKRIIAGRHRYKACVYLGWEEIPCIIVDGTPLELELITLDENLCRRQVAVLERAQMLKRRKAIYEQMFPDTTQGKAGAAARNGTNGHAQRTFTEDTAIKTGKSQRTIQNEVALGESIPEDVAEAIKGTPIADNKSELQKLSALDEDEQRETAQRIKNGEATRVEPVERDGGRQKLIKEGLKQVGCLSRTLQQLGLFRIHAEMLQEIKNSLVDAGAQG